MNFFRTSFYNLIKKRNVLELVYIYFSKLRFAEIGFLP
ncbi:hypothetical protein LEP1GSC072_0708 [Leptospira noguchii str. Bonito]|nr:hypothetical protein LEP1GSC072_0708 [Leptospira noguchii str. Bonito]